VLVIAGAMKRADPDLPEDAVLARALRDSNIPKIVEEDKVVFFGLLGDLFPGIDPPRKRDPKLEGAIVDACGELGNWPDEDFCLKCVQLEELLAIRHCVFVMGPAGAGKSQCWRTLAHARKLMSDDLQTTIKDLNPKSVRTEELYGYISMATREWRDGLLSVVMRNLGRVPDEKPKWILLDGDLDANWIESMNSVMDDNKLLTLASNERVPLNPHMRLIFEIRDLKYATPATVSRAGILYISTDEGFQWKSLINTWIQEKSDGYTDETRTWLSSCFDAYVPNALRFFRKMLTSIPQQETTLVSNLLKLLDALLTPRELAAQKNVEMTFVFACVWAVGSAMGVADDGKDYRKIFSEWWKKTFRNVQFPSKDTVFDYWLDAENMVFESWKESPAFSTLTFDSKTQSMSDVTVPTSESASVTFFMGKLIKAHHCVMLAGPSGTGTLLSAFVRVVV